MSNCISYLEKAPIVGLFIGHVIMALGVAKGIGSAHTPVTKTTTRNLSH